MAKSCGARVMCFYHLFPNADLIRAKHHGLRLIGTSQDSCHIVNDTPLGFPFIGESTPILFFVLSVCEKREVIFGDLPATFTLGPKISMSSKGGKNWNTE